MPQMVLYVEMPQVAFCLKNMIITVIIESVFSHSYVGTITSDG